MTLEFFTDFLQSYTAYGEHRGENSKVIGGQIHEEIKRPKFLA